MNNITFVGAHDLMIPYINKLSETNVVFLYESSISSVALSSKVKIISLKKTLFGIEKLIRGEISIPWYLSGLNKNLKHSKPDTVIVLDFIRFWYWQVIWYRWWNPSVKVILYTETQRVPKSSASKLAFSFFEFFFLKTSKFIDRIVPFTNLGLLFFEKYELNIQISVAPPLVNTSIFYPAKNKEYMPGGVLRVLINARYVDYKRHTTLFKAVSKLDQKENLITVTCIGRGGKDQTKISDEANKLGIRERVFFLDSVKKEELFDVYSKHDVLVLPSDGEAIGMVVPEAMACGLPTITSDTVGGNVYVEENVTGFIFKTNDADALMNKLVLCANPETLSKMGFAAKNKVSKEFSETFFKKEFLDALND